MSPDDPEEAQPIKDKDRLNREYGLISHHLDQGLNLIRQAHYRQANEFLASRSSAKPVGVDVSGALPLLLEPQDLTVQNLPHLAYILTDGFWHRFDSKAVKVATIGLTESETKYSPELLTQLHQEAALLSAEEWTHVLQFLQRRLGRGSYVSQALAQVGKDGLGEIDVAFYFNEKGIPLKGTQWEKRYGRQDMVKF